MNCTHERFLRDVDGFKLSIVRSAGLDRHLRFRRPGRSEYWFDLVTWPGALCINGDCGTYVFSRIDDMFQFFRKEPGRINPSYWSEKCTAMATGALIRKFSRERFRSEVVRAFRDAWRGGGSRQLGCFRALRQGVLDPEPDNEFEAYSALSDFEFDGFRFEDYYELRFQEYSFHFLWCLHAIVWGIEQFDAAVAAAEVTEHA